MARFRHHQLGNSLDLEAPLYDLVGAQLKAMGHTVKSVDGEDLGGAQIIRFVTGPAAGGTPGGYYRSGSDFRKDGQAVGW
jgi:gamma-glutamyltranspeptidase/glutathione hydrolase